VVDGGTDSGVMQLLGRARADLRAAFPLVGVAAEKKIVLPGDGTEQVDRAPLEPNHSHLCWCQVARGDESPWLARMATALAGGLPSVTVLINGGAIALQDVAHSLAAGRPVLVIAGSGRTADRIAAALKGARLHRHPHARPITKPQVPATVRCRAPRPGILRSAPP
jgi:hypothetical protein